MRTLFLIACLAGSNLVFAQIPTGNLEAYYPFNGIPNDESTNVNDGIVNGATLGEDRFGNLSSAYEFDGQNDWINIGDNPTLHYSNTSSNSISVRFKCNSTAAYQNLIRYDEKDNADGTTLSPGIPRSLLVLRTRNADGDMDLDFEYSFGNYVSGNDQRHVAIHNSDDYSINEWHHLVAIKDQVNDSVFIYLNGQKVLSEEDQSFGTWETTGQFMMFGRYADNTTAEFFSGSLDDIRLDSDALTPCEVWALCTEGTTGGLDLTISQSGNTLTSNQNNSAYQWIDCETNASIPGATNQSLTVTSNGSYAVILNPGARADTTACFAMDHVGADENAFGNGIKISPNPSNGKFVLELDKHYSGIKLSIVDLKGRTVKFEENTNGNVTTVEINESPGVYLLIVEAQNKGKVLRLMVE
ncbi:MAG: T9SS type A sorting domain-containing protein [Crocinitomicaceae bacterium]|nr:T9SS type A sorting domain-containing protein [Crocinitomicaceae bacterium]